LAWCFSEPHFVKKVREETLLRRTWKFSVMCVRKPRQQWFVAQMRQFCVPNVMLKFMLQTSLQASIRGFFFNVYQTSFPDVTYVRYL